MELLDAGRLSDVEKKTRKLIKKFPNAVALASILGVALADQGKFGEAASCHRRVLRYVPEYAEAHYNLGVALMSLGELEDARASFEAAIRFKPTLTEAHNNLGIVLHQLGRPEAAVARYRQALTLRPDFADVHSNLGKALLALERSEEAIGSCQEALRIDPKLTDTRQVLGRALENLGHLNEALKAFDEELDLQPDNAHVSICRASLLERLGQPDNALGVYDVVLSHDGACAEAHVRRAQLLMELGRNDDAREAVEGILSLQKPHSIGALHALSQFPASMINVDILSMIDDAVPEDDSSKEEFDSMCAFTRATELHKAGRYAEAWENLIIANRHWSRQKQDNYVRKREEREVALAWLRDAPAASTPEDIDGYPLSLHIFGPSRSGKTTLEKLAAFLDGTKLGFESSVVSNALRRAFEALGVPQTTRLIETSPAMDATFREAYFIELDKMAAGARIFTSTTPGSIVNAQRMAVVLPNSRFIFTQRDVSDTCLRIYMKMYARGNDYAYDFDNILEYLTWYDEMSGILAERFPHISKTIRYEDMIAEPASTLRSVAQLCGAAVPKDVTLPSLHDDRGCAAPYQALIDAAT